MIDWAHSWVKVPANRLTTEGFESRGQRFVTCQYRLPTPFFSLLPVHGICEDDGLFDLTVARRDNSTGSTRDFYFYLRRPVPQATFPCDTAG